MKWDNTDAANKKKWVVKSKRLAEYQTLKGTAGEFRNFLNTQPDVETIASELSGLVDLLLVTGNRGLGEYEPGEYQLLDTWQKYIPIAWRAGKVSFVEDDLRNWVAKEAKTYKDRFRAPWIYVSSLYTFTYQLGFCEEHAALACHFLIDGGLHPQSKPPLHGTEENQVDVTREIYFAIVGAVSWPSGHAFVVLAKGNEFAESIKNVKKLLDAKGKDGRVKVFDYILERPELWGKNAWVADGWLGYSYTAADIQKIFKKEFIDTGDFKFKVNDNDWKPFHMGSLFLRICEHYDIDWDL